MLVLLNSSPDGDESGDADTRSGPILAHYATMNLRNKFTALRSSRRIPRSHGTGMMSNHKRLGLLFAAAFTVVVAAGCNEHLRQSIVPVHTPTGDPGALSHAVILSTNPAPSSNGSTLHIDVSGDTVAGVVPTGPNPVFLGKTPGRVFVINGDDTITS